MFKLLATAAVALVLSSAAQAEGVEHDANIPGLTADGTWDCNDASGAYLGAVVIADKSYAFVDADGAVGSYGKLSQVPYGEAPSFVVLGGALKEKLGVVAMHVQGPPGREMDFSDWSKLVLYVAVTDTNKFQCVQRRGSAT